MKAENLVPVIILACGLIQIFLGVIFFIDSPLVGLGWGGGIVTAISIGVIGIFNIRSKNKMAVLGERFSARFYPKIVLAYGITNIGIALTISSVFYDVGAIKGIEVLIFDIVGFLFIGWGIPLVLLSLSEFREGRKV